MNQLIFPLDHQYFCKYSQHTFIEQKPDCLHMKKFYFEIMERELSWKTAYAIIVANSTKWDCSHLFGCDNFDPLTWRNPRHFMFTIAELLVWTVDRMGLCITNWVTKPAQVAKKFLRWPIDVVFHSTWIWTC